MKLRSEQATTYWVITKLSFLESGEVEVNLTRYVEFISGEILALEVKQYLLTKAQVDALINAPTSSGVTVREAIVTSVISSIGL